MTFGEKLKAARTAKGLTQSGLGAGRYSASYISLLESGQRQPSKEMALHFAQLLRLDPAEVLAWIRTGPSDDSGALAAAMHHAQKARELKDYSLAALEAEYAASLAHEQGDTVVWRHFTNLQADAYAILRRHDETEAKLVELLAHPMTLEQPELHATALGGLARVRRFGSDLPEALALARQAATAADPLPEYSETRLMSKFVLIASLSVLGLLDEAWEEAQSLSGIEEIGGVPSPTIGRAGWVLGNIAFRRGDVDTGLAQHALAAQHIPPHADIQLWSHFNLASAGVRLRAGLCDAGVERCLDNADLGLQVAGTDVQRAELLLAKAQLQALRGQMAEVVSLLRTVQEQDVDLEFEHAGLMERLWGRYHASTDDLLRARSHYLKAAQLYSDAGDSDMASELLEELLDVSS
ncbi:helix-turn-helix domain-containing protein [Arthrobacter sp. TMN-37]